MPTDTAMNKKIYHDIGQSESILGNEFDRLLYAMNDATDKIQAAFEGLHESLDNIHRILEANCNSSSRNSRKLLDHRQWLRRQGSLMMSPSTSSMYFLKEATEMAREAIRSLTNLLFLETDADRTATLTLKSRHAELLETLKPYLESPVFEKFRHIKYGLNHCVANILLKASDIPARTQNVMVGNSTSKNSAEKHEELQLKRFYNKGKKALESFVGRTEDKWSERQKNQFIKTCKLVWDLQNIVATTMATHVVEILHPQPNSKFEADAMDTMDRVSDASAHFLVQFTVFHGFSVDGSILIRPQVYLHMKTYPTGKNVVKYV